jgi:hypothetical protein
LCMATSTLDIDLGFQIHGYPRLRMVRADIDVHLAERGVQLHRPVTTCDGRSAASHKPAAAHGHAPPGSRPAVPPADDADEERPRQQNVFVQR